MDNEELNQLIDLFFGNTGKQLGNMTEEQMNKIVDKVMEEAKRRDKT